MLLQDITIYYEGNVIVDSLSCRDFRRKINFIADFYHNSLNGYKPPKTRRICIFFNKSDGYYKSYFFGSICNGSASINAGLYLSLTQAQQSEYILELLHGSVMELANLYGWEKNCFQNAYEYIVNAKFRFEKKYPVKNSPNRKYNACVVLGKTETDATLYVIITGEKNINKIILKKSNWYWWDSTYSIAKNCKWLGNDFFGIDNNDRKCYLSIKSEEVIASFLFKESDF